MSECQGETEGGQSGSAFESGRSHVLSRSALRGMSWNTGWSSCGPRLCRLDDIAIVRLFWLACDKSQSRRMLSAAVSVSVLFAEFFRLIPLLFRILPHTIGNSHSPLFDERRTETDFCVIVKSGIVFTCKLRWVDRFGLAGGSSSTHEILHMRMCLKQEGQIVKSLMLGARALCGFLSECRQHHAF
jgi:hypothetical protein